MLKISEFEVMGWKHAIRGMRNPLNSWDRSDSGFGCDYSDQHFCSVCEDGHTEACPYCFTQYKLGSSDLNLMKRLRNAGTDHRKFMRMITVYIDITAPLYWWKEFDTYKVGTVANSCSTMHKIAEKEFTLADFSCEHLINNQGLEIEFATVENEVHLGKGSFNDIFRVTIDALNLARNLYLNAKDKDKKKYWWQMIQLLPSSYNQKRTVMLNYEVLANIYKSRRNHKLDEWHTFCNWIEELPYSELITRPSLNDIPISKEIMEEAERRVEMRIAKQHETICKSFGIDLANGTDFTGETEMVSHE